MAQLLLQYMRAVKTGNWELHKETSKQVNVWVFAYDRVNYKKSLTTYNAQMATLHKTHPETHAKLASGQFGAKHSKKAFARVPEDQCLEQTQNRDQKTPGGIRGYSSNSKGAVQRWAVNAHERAAITRSATDMAGITCDSSTKHHELSVTRTRADEGFIRALMQEFCLRENMFADAEDRDAYSTIDHPGDSQSVDSGDEFIPVDGEEIAVQMPVPAQTEETCSSEESVDQFETTLIHVASGEVACKQVRDDLLNVKPNGTEAERKFVQTRLVDRTVAWSAPEPKLKLKTFADNQTT